jgi:hypothetical protein
MGKKIFQIETPSVEGNLIMNVPRIKRHVPKYKKYEKTKKHRNN